MNDGRWIASLCMIVGAVSCVPVHYDAKNWMRVKSYGSSSEMEASIHLLPSKSNAFNSNSDGPWTVTCTIRSEKVHRITIKQIIIREPDGRVLRFAPHHEMVVERHHSGHPFIASYDMEEKVALSFSPGKVTTVEIEALFDGKRSRRIKADFRADKIEEWETINILFM